MDKKKKKRKVIAKVDLPVTNPKLAKSLNNLDREYIPAWKRNGYQSKESAVAAINKALGIE